MILPLGISIDIIVKINNKLATYLETSYRICTNSLLCQGLKLPVLDIKLLSEN